MLVGLLRNSKSRDEIFGFEGYRTIADGLVVFWTMPLSLVFPMANPMTPNSFAVAIVPKPIDLFRFPSQPWVTC